MRCPQVIKQFHPRQQRLDKLPIEIQTLEDAKIFSIESEPAHKRKYFVEIQHRFIPHKFLKTTELQSFDNNRVLPYMAQEQIGAGNFGTVFKMQLEPSLQDLGLTPDKNGRIFVIRKVLKSLNKQLVLLHDRNTGVVQRNKLLEEFGKELNPLAYLGELGSPNVIPLLCAYINGAEWNLIFRCEEMNLESFLKLDRKRNPLGSFKHNFTFYSALHGISTALRDAHNLVLTRAGEKVSKRYLHGDLWPANILVNKDTFILADFGLATEMTQNDVNHYETSWKSHGQCADCRAPETEDDEPRVTQALDIWALGCIFAEIATYIEKGKAGVDGFREQRFEELRLNGRRRCGDQYFYLNGSPKVLKNSVMRQFEELSKAPGDRHIPELLEIAKQLLNINPIQRPSAKDLCERMFFLSVKSLFNAILGEFRQPGAEKRIIETWGDVLGLTRPWIPASGARINALGMPCRQKLLRIFQGLHDKGELPTRGDLMAICDFLTASERARVPISAR
ncbi:kinase-like domain-containing protein [Morchella snyderi]|nr:kinase-like domain-containing protein [Morchella snyderi]